MSKEKRTKVHKTYNINVSIGRDCGCEISDEDMTHYLRACATAINAAYPVAVIDVSDHEGTGTRVRNTAPWAHDDDINEVCVDICQDVWVECCADGFL